MSSADGRFVAFSSDADKLSGQDNDAVINVFVRDLEANTTTYVRRASGAAGAAGDGNSSDASISADGRFVAFQPLAATDPSRNRSTPNAPASKSSPASPAQALRARAGVG